jgi:N-acetyl-anhydromuramyl-L-alanine amidase AmpD
MMEDPQRGTVTGCLVYRRVMAAIRRQYGDQHRVIITECGLARAVKHGMPDVGWLYEADPIPEEQYIESLRWYNRELCRDAYVLGGCLYEVGHAGDWYSFRHLGTDHRGKPLRVIEQIARFREEPMPEPVPPSEPVPPQPEPQPQSESRVPAPAIEDVSAQLPVHPQRRYPQRAMSDIRRLIIHHTGVSSDPDPEVIARYQVSQRGMPGIGYHFLIRFDGRIQQTQPLTVTSTHTTRNNEDSVGIAFAGNFMQEIPTPAQLASGAHLCAYLLDQLGLPISVIVGRREVEGGTASPGSQWNEGVRWRETLLAGVTQRLEAAGVPILLTRRAAPAVGEETETRQSLLAELAELQRLAERLQTEVSELVERLTALAEEMTAKE